MNIKKKMNKVHQRETLSEEKGFSRLSSKLKSNKFENDATYPLQISGRFLMVLGICRRKEADKLSWRFVLAIISVITCYAGLGMSVIPMGLYIAEMKDPIEKIKLTGPWSFCLMAALKYFFLRSNRCDIEKCMKHMDLDWSSIESSHDRVTMREHARYGHLVTITSAVFGFSGGLFFAILPVVIKLKTDNGNDNNNNNINMTARQLSLPSNFVFFVVTETPVYEIVYAIQMLASFMMHSIAVTCYSLAAVIVMHVSGQVKILMGKIDTLADEQDDSSTKKNTIDDRLSDVVRHHVKVLRFILLAERMLREICLVDLGGGTLLLCFSGYLLLLEWESDVADPIALITYVMLFASFVFNIYLFCYIGELLTGECRKIGDTTYMIDWYHLPYKKSRELCLIIAMAQKPVNLTAGGAIQFSYVCFTSVVKTAFGYLNMLRAVMD